jgi:hypothetical protein
MHQEVGWTTQEIARTFLHWLRRQMPREMLLLSDLFAAHRRLVVKHKV